MRKGATPAFPVQRGFVCGSIGDDAVIIEDVDSEAARVSLYSTVHARRGRPPAAAPMMFSGFSARVNVLVRC